jgi:hypothetical protein
VRRLSSSPRVPVVNSGEVAAQVVDTGDAPGVSGGDGVVDKVRKESAMPRVWSTSLGVIFCDVCTWTEEFWAPAAWNSVMPSKCYMKIDRGGIRRREQNRGEGNSKQWRRLPSGSSTQTRRRRRFLLAPARNCHGLVAVFEKDQRGDERGVRGVLIGTARA